MEGWIGGRRGRKDGRKQEVKAGTEKEIWEKRRG